MAPSVTASSPTVGKRRDSLINSMFASSAKRTISLEPLPEPDEPKTEMSTSLSLPAILESSLDDEKIAMLIEAASFLDRAEAEALLVECSWNVDVATDKANRRHKHDDEGDSTFDKARGKLAKFLTKRKSAYGSSAAASLYATVRNPLVVAGKFSSPAVPITAAQQPPRQWFDEEHVSSSDDDVEGQNNRSARKSRKRRFIVDEIVRTEETHCQQMKYIYQSIVLELRRSSRLTDPIMPAEEIDAIFSTFEEMLTIHADLLLALQPKLASWADDTCLAPLFIKLFENPKPFEDFGDNFVKGKDRFQSHVRQSPKLQALLEKFFEDSRVRVHSVVEILRLPLQRVPRYRELLRELSLYTSPGHPDYNDMQDVIKQVELVHNKIQSLTIKEDSIKAMYLVQQNIIGCPSTIINSERYVMYELDAIELHVETNKIKQIVRIVLFNDLLLLATKVDRRRGLFMELFTTTLHGFSKDSEAQYRLDGLFPLQDVGLLDSSTDTYLNGLGSFLVLWVNDSARMFQATTTANFKHFLPQLKETLQKFPMAAETKERLNVFQSGEHTAVIASNGGDHDEEPSLERTRRMSLNPMASRRGRLRTKSDSKRGDRPNLDSLLENLSSALKPTAPVPSVPIRQPTGDEKLEDFLQDSEGLEVFSAFLKGEYSSENVEFWLAVERFREIGDADRIKAAELIMKLFIRPNGDQEVNIKYQLKDNLIHQFEAGEVEATMFDTTQKDIFALMATDSFPRFLRSKFFQEFHPAAKQRDSISGTSPRSASSFDI